MSNLNHKLSNKIASAKNRKFSKLLLRRIQERPKVVQDIAIALGHLPQ